MGNVIQLTTENFNNEVIASEKPILVDFYATWCMPCKILSPILEELAKEFEGHIKFGKVDVEKAYPLAVRYEISGVPTLILFKGGIILDIIVGLMSPQALRSRLERAIE
jgi:thioredoxin 1